jgi:hypothetical protein
MSALSQKTMARVFPMCLTVVFGVSCRDKGSTSASEADVMTTLSSQSGSNIMLESALITDLNADDMSKRIEWIARQATAAGANNLPAVQNLDGSQSGCQTKEMGVIDEGGALPLPDGRVIYCSGGRLSYAQQDSESQQLLLKLGVTSSELSGVRFYRVPTSTPNAWATVTESNVAVVALYDGLAADARKYNLDPYSLVAVALAHEVGHIIDMKKSGFTNLRSAQKRIWDDCEFRAQKVDSQAPSKQGKKRVQEHFQPPSVHTNILPTTLHLRCLVVKSLAKSSTQAPLQNGSTPKAEAVTTLTVHTLMAKNAVFNSPVGSSVLGSPLE